MISYLIPTINRSDLLIKNLTYLDQSGFTGQVIIGDSSNKSEYGITAKFIQNNLFEFSIKHIEYPNYNNSMCIREMIHFIENPYSVFVCDDDIHVTDTMKKCMEFLEKNTDYIACGGKVVACDISFHNLNKINTTWEYIVREIPQNKSRDRITSFMNNYSVIAYSLSRTEDFIKRWVKGRIIDKYEIKDRAVISELMPCMTIAAQGKVKMLDDLYVVRQIHNKRDLMPDIYDSIREHHWSHNICYINEYIAEIVAEIDSISFDESYSIVKEALYNYFIIAITNKNRINTSKNNSLLKILDLRSAIKAIPGSKEVALWLRSILIRFVSNYDFMLPTLLNSSSRYHKDFMPVYKVITKQSVINQ